MKTRIAVGIGLLLTIGSAVAGSLLYVQGYSTSAESFKSGAVMESAAEQQVTPEMIAMWKATAVSSGYTAPRVPI